MKKFYNHKLSRIKATSYHRIKFVVSEEVLFTEICNNYVTLLLRKLCFRNTI